MAKKSVSDKTDNANLERRLLNPENVKTPAPKIMSTTSVLTPNKRP